MGAAAAIGFSVHTGWAAAVALKMSAREPSVIERVRLELLDQALPAMVFHAVERAPLADAEAAVRRARESARRLARAALDGVAARVRASGLDLRAAGIALPSGKLPPTLAQVLASHALIHAAEGELFRSALVEACEALGLRVRRVLRKNLFRSAARELGRAEAALKKIVADAGKALGPPWTTDEKESMLLAWLALAAKNSTLRPTSE